MGQETASHSHKHPSKKEVIAKTPDPAVRSMLSHLEGKGIETCFDRHDAQGKRCVFGNSGLCCKNCHMGPCRITPKSPRGVCGAGGDLIVARNMLRWVAAGVAAHGARGREVMLALKAAANGQVDLPLLGEGKIRAVAKALKIYADNKPLNVLAGEIADILLEDLSRSVPGPHRTLHALAPKERIDRWAELGILPVSAYHEVFEALHRTTTGTDGSWENIMTQFLRCGLAFAWTSVMGSAIAMDCLYGPPHRSEVETNLGSLKDGYVNIALHGHAPALVRTIVEAGREKSLLGLAEEAGAKGIRFYGICCSGLSAMYRMGGVQPLANAMGAELALGTGALDLWVVDMQDVFPSIMDVANCFKTQVITTSDSCRLPGALHIGLERDLSNLNALQSLGSNIVENGIRSFAARQGIERFVPEETAKAEIGFSIENVFAQFEGAQGLLAPLKDGRIRGIVNLVGCNNPKVLYEDAVVKVADELISKSFLVVTNGCASFPLLKLGYCSNAALSRAGEGLKGVLSSFAKPLPPVWHMGECLDNARASGLFRALADAASENLPRMPFAFASPEWSNEKGVGAALGFRLMGLDSYHCVRPPVEGSEKVSEFIYNGTFAKLGSKMVVEENPSKLAKRIVSDIEERRTSLGWR